MRTAIVTLAGWHTLTVPFAVTPAERAEGLSMASHLPMGSGMLFAVRPGDSFTMRPMRIGLDMVWIGRGGVLCIDPHLRAGSGDVMVPPAGAEYLLEIGAGAAARLSAGTAAEVVIR